MVAADGGVTRIERTAKGLVRAVVDAEGARTEVGQNLRRDDVVVERWVDGALVRRTLAEWDAAGVLREVVGPAPGQKVTLTRDRAGRVTSSVDATARGQRVEYDQGGRLVSWWDRAVAVAGGGAMPENRPQGRVEYGLADEVRWTTDVLGRATELLWDFAPGDGSVVYPKSGASRGRLVGVVQADGTTQGLRYDAVGRLARRVDEIGREVGFAYDGLDRLTTATDAGGGRTVFGYDLQDRVRRQVLPDGTAVDTGLSAAGEVVWQELSGWVSGAGADPQASGPMLRHELSYDALGRVSQVRSGVVSAPGTALSGVDAPVGSVAEQETGPVSRDCGYDLLGRAVPADNAWVRVRHQYNRLSGFLSRTVQSFGQAGAGAAAWVDYVIERTYRDNGTRLGSLTYPGGAAVEGLVVVSQ